MPSYFILRAGACPITSMQAPAPAQDRPLISLSGFVLLLFLVILGLVGALVFVWALGAA